jgi:hypothetical protein
VSSGTRPPKSVTHAPAQKPRPAPPKPRPRVPAGVVAGGERGWASAPAPPFGIAGPALFQRKLAIGAPDDAYEREADQVADQVAGGGPTAPPRITPVTPTALAPAVRREMEEDEGRVQRATAGDRTAHDDEPSPVHAEAPPPAPVAPPPPPPPIPHAATDEMRKADAPAPIVQRATAGDVTAHDHEERDPRVRSSLPVQRSAKDEEDERAGTDGGPAMRDAAARAIATRGPGAPLIPTVRETLQSRLGVELGGVRVHTGPDAERATGALRARAFTHGADIWLGRGESAADTRLVAHEVAHVVQQGAAAPRPAAPAPAAASPAPGPVQRLGIPDWLLERAEGYARQLPGWTLFTVIIGYNPLLRRNVDRTAVNLVGGFMGLVPFGTAIFDKLNEYGIIQGAFDWVQAELRRLDLSLGRLERTLDAAWADVHLTEGFDYNYRVLERHFGALYDDVVAFATSLVDHVVQLIKDAAIGVAEGLLAENHAWALIKKILGRDPLRDVEVQATPTEILSDFLMLIGKEEHLRQMRERGTLEETANWLATQIGAFLNLLSELRGLVTRAWDAIQPSALPHLLDNLRSLAADAGGFLQRVWDFATTVAAKVLELVKKSLLGWLASVAEETPGFHLVTVILGRNPFTGEAVPRTAANLIRGFITLLPNGQAIYARLAESGTVARAAARIQGAVEELGISWDFIVGIFTGIWEGLSIEDLIHPVDAFMRIVGEFGEPISRLFRFVGVVLREMITIILEIMNFPSDLIGSIVANAMAAIEDIKRDPVGFLLHMIEALKRGFSNFFAHIATHLAGGLADWLFRGLRQAGLEPPRDLSLGSVLDFVLQVLGITVDRLWQKLGERIGPERVAMIRGALDRLTGVIAFVRDVQQRGIAAIWEYIESQISGLWDMVLQKAKDWIMERIINRAIQWLLSLLDVTGIMPVINSAMTFFRAVQSAIDYLRDILAIINDYVTTIAAVARGEIEPGAQKVELGLAHAVPVAIGFLANQFGLGNIGEKITEIVGGIREVVDHALDWLIDRAVTGVQSLLQSLGVGPREAAAADPSGVHDRPPLQESFDFIGEDHSLRLAPAADGSVHLMMASENWTNFPDVLRRLQTQHVPRLRADNRQDDATLLNTSLQGMIDESVRVGAPEGPVDQARKAHQRRLEGVPTSQRGAWLQANGTVNDAMTDAWDEFYYRYLTELRRLDGLYDFSAGVRNLVTVGQVLADRANDLLIRVTEVNERDGSAYGARAVPANSSATSGGRFYDFARYAATGTSGWGPVGTKPPLLPYSPVAAGGGAWRSTVRHVRINVASPLGTPSNPAEAVPGIALGRNQRGHLIARTLGGPGNWASGNIVAMTTNANQGEMARKLENPVRAALQNDPQRNNPALQMIMEITAQPQNWASPDYPNNVHVTYQQIYPLVTTAVADDVDNT